MKETSKNRFDEIKAIELKNARTWLLKESMRKLWSDRSTCWATRNRLLPMIEAAKLIARHPWTDKKAV